MARLSPGWAFKKGAEAWQVIEQVRLSPAPKLGGWAGKQLRFLSVSRGQSVITDLEQGSLAINRRRTGLPSMQRMWFHHPGYSLGYTKPRGSPEPAELFFFDPEARLTATQRLPAAVIEASAGSDAWFVACRNGRVYAFGLEGGRLWSQLIPCPRRDNSTNELWGLPVFHPRLNLAADGGLLAIGAEQRFHRYQLSGERLWTEALPARETSEGPSLSIDLPSRARRLATLGISQTAESDRVRTGYVRLKLDTLLNAGWLKQVQVSDIETAGRPDVPSPAAAFQIAIGLPVEAGISVLGVSVNAIVIGTQDGFVDVLDHDGRLRNTFRVGETSVSDLLVRGGCLKAACCGSRLTLFEHDRVSGTTDLPEHYAQLASCGQGVLAWKLNSLWLVEPSGRVQVAAETDRPIRGAWGHDTGFYVLSTELASVQFRQTATRGKP